MNFAGIELHEHEDLEHVVKLADLLRRHGEVFAALYRHHGEVEAAESALEESYQGAYDSSEAWAEEFLESTGAFPKGTETLQQYFDFERYLRDLELGGDIYMLTTPDGRCHIFWNR
jgi:antirestriction protein